MAAAPTPVATLIGDVVGSRTHDDRAALHRALTAALKGSRLAYPAEHGPGITAGDEFEAAYATLGIAIGVAVALRVELLPEVDLRFGLGVGAVTVLGREAGAQDGPGWWAARAAIEDVEQRARRAATRSARMAYRTEDPKAPPPAAVDPALACLDALIGELDERSLRLLRGMLAGRSQQELAAEEGVTTSAVSQRVRGGSLVVIADAVRQLTTL